MFFVCGDDDQSVYSFRYASPEGIIEFVNRHSLAIGRELTNCFRCTPSILASASSLFKKIFPGPNPNLQNIQYHCMQTLPQLTLGIFHTGTLELMTQKQATLLMFVSNLLIMGYRQMKY